MMILEADETDLYARSGPSTQSFLQLQKLWRSASMEDS